MRAYPRAAPLENGAGAKSGPWVLAAAILGSSMAFIDGTVVNVALAAIQHDLGATINQVQWVIELYALFLAALLLTGGSLGDIYGQRKVFAAGVIVFSFGSGWCGLAHDIHQLIAARGLQGVGGALLVPGSLALISVSFPTADRGRAIGTWSSFTAITAAIGPVLGGWIVQHASWRWVFFINLPLAALVLAVTYLRVPNIRPRSRMGKLDWPGTFLATFGLGGVLFGFIQSAPSIGWAGAAVLAAFAFVEARAVAPMFPLTLFRSRTFAGANLLTFMLYAALNGLLFFLPLNLIQVQGYSPTEAGLALLPLILLIFVLSPWAGGLTRRYGPKLPLVTGSLIAALGFALFAKPEIGGSYWTTLFPPVVLLGLGMGIIVAPLTTTVMSSIPQSRAGIASGVNNAVSRVAGALAVAVFGLLLSNIFDRALIRHLDHLHIASSQRAQILSQWSKLAGIQTDNPNARDAVNKAFIAGYRVVVSVAAGLAMLSAVSAMAMIETDHPVAAE